LGAARASWRAWLAWAAVCLTWGTTGPGIHLAVRSVPPFLLGAARFVVAGAILVVAVLMRGGKLPRDAGTWRDVLLTGALLAAANGLFGTGFIVVSGAVGTLIVSTTAIWLTCIEALRPGGLRPGWKAAAGLVLGLGGVAVLLPWEGGFRPEQAASYGILLASSIIWSLSAVYQRARRLGERLDPLMSAGLQLLVSGAFMWAAGMALGEGPRWRPTTEGWIAIGYLTVFGSLVGFVAFVYMLERLPADVVGLYTYLNPLVAAVVDLALFREPLGVRFWAASVPILAGVYLVQRSEREKRRI